MKLHLTSHQHLGDTIMSEFWFLGELFLLCAPPLNRNNYCCKDLIHICRTNHKTVSLTLKSFLVVTWTCCEWGRKLVHELSVHQSPELQDERRLLSYRAAVWPQQAAIWQIVSQKHEAAWAASWSIRNIYISVDDCCIFLWSVKAAGGHEVRCLQASLLSRSPPFKMSAAQWGQKNASKSDSWSGLSRMESVCAGEGFYQRQTLTGSPVWDCPSNSCVPQEALHKKQLKNARRHFICRRPTHGEQLDPAALLSCLIWTQQQQQQHVLKDSGDMDESSNAPPDRRLVPTAAAQPARAHAPDDLILRG